MRRLIATFFGVGTLPGAPGTWGSLAALPIAWGLHGSGGFPALAAATLAAVLVGLWATARIVGDPPEVVIDEVAGQWLALWPLSAGLWLADTNPWAFACLGWLPAFAAFRMFDIWKPGPVGWADRRGDATGVMLDDLVAGALAAATLAVAAALAHGWLL